MGAALTGKGVAVAIENIDSATGFSRKKAVESVPAKVE